MRALGILRVVLLLRIPMVLLALLAAAPAALAQEASDAETATLSAIGNCLVQGLTRQWTSVEMLVELNEPGSDNGNVEYIAVDEENWREPFTPCDVKKPVTLLLRLRERQPAERRGWTAARLVLRPSGEFQLNYDYPR